jgi:hypothetical protein
MYELDIARLLSRVMAIVVSQESSSGATRRFTISRESRRFGCARRSIGCARRRVGRAQLQADKTAWKRAQSSYLRALAIALRSAAHKNPMRSAGKGARSEGLRAHRPRRH